MKLVRMIALASLLILPIVLHRSIHSNNAPEATDQPKPKLSPGGRARLSEHVSLQAAGRGNPWINLADGRDLLTEYDGVKLDQLASQGTTQSLSLASADFDEDGVPDLVGGYGSQSGGLVTLHRGNLDSIYPNSPEAKQRQANGERTDAPFLSPALTFTVPEPPDFIAAGDFDGDSHWDVATAARGSNVLYLLSGDGRGNFGQAQPLMLAGHVTAMVCGDINRRDGLNDLVVGIAGPQGQKALVFESPEGALRGVPEAIALPAEASALAIGQLDDDYAYDVAIAAGHELLIVQGRDRKLSLDETQRTQVVPARVKGIALSSAVKAMAVGNFAGDHHAEIALLDEAGKAHLASRQNKKWRVASLADGKFEPTSQIISARVSSLPHDSLVLVDEKNKQLHVLIDSQPSEMLDLQTASSGLRSLQAVTLDVEDRPVAVLPMRLNSDALSGLVILKKGAESIAVAPTAPMSTFIVSNTNDSGAGSLRQAIKDANDHAGADAISFNIPGPGVHTITPLNALLINSPVTIDGYTQPGASPNTLANGDNAVILIELNGASAPLVSGLSLQTTGGSTIRGLVINRFQDNGIFLGSVSNNIIEGNFIGTNAAGTADLGNAGRGVIIGPGSNNTIGGMVAAARNIISGNDDRGIEIAGNSSTGNQIQGNFIGTNANGTADLGNTHEGVRTQNAPSNTVGGTASGARNIISGNNAEGAAIVGSSAAGSLVQGNYIGTDVNGIADLGNTGAGVHIAAAFNNIVGGTVGAARNIISGNDQNGVLIDGTGSGNQVQGNFIGTDVNGTADLGNTLAGLLIDNAPNNTIGGTVGAARNVISGNNSHGVFSFEASSTGNQVPGNFIGTDITGTAALGNAGNGVFASFSPNNAIGSTSGGTGNVIAFNGARGVYVLGGSSKGNSILGNSIHSNNALGIDLSPVGVTANDAGDADTGPNNLQNFPVLTAASTIAVQGTLNSTANTSFRIEFFLNLTCDSSGNGEGQTFLGTTTVTTNGSGNANIVFTFPSAVMLGQVITATATDPTGNTSEFSQCVAVTTSTPTHPDTIGLYNPTASTYFLRNSNSTGVADISFAYGPTGAGWIPLAGDWNGDGTDTIGLYNPATSTFYLRNTNTTGVADITFAYGPAGAGWLPIVGDWNGDGTDTIGLYNPTASTYFLRNANSTGVADVSFAFGPAGAGWTPIVGDWNGDGTDTIGLYNPAASAYFLRNANSTGVADVSFSYGPAGAGWKPLVGDWDGL